jgi:hypothetical protein
MTFGPAGSGRDRGVIGVAGGTDRQEVAELLAPSAAGTPRNLDPREAGWSLPLTLRPSAFHQAPLVGPTPLLARPVSCQARLQRIAEGDG